MGTDDADWDAAKGGEDDAFARVFRRHRDRVRRHAYRLAGSDSEAEDVVAISFFEAWRLRERARFVDGSLLPWLLNIATNVARNQARAARRYREMLERLPPALDVLPVEPREEEVLEAVLALAPRYRDVVVLSLVEGFSESETAEVLGIKPGTVKSRLSVARRQLRSDLAPTQVIGEPNHA